MVSTERRKADHAFIIVSNLLPLLIERGKTQKDLAVKTRLTQARINRIARKSAVHRIVSSTAIKICFALSDWPRLEDEQKIKIGLDALFPMKPHNV